VPYRSLGCLLPALQPLFRDECSPLRAGLGVALSGESVIVSDRLWAYEIEAAAMELASSEAVAGVVRVRAYGDKVSFEPVEPG
jgi:hypothetical protein